MNPSLSLVLYALRHNPHGLKESIRAVAEASLLAGVQAAAAGARALLETQLANATRLLHR